MLPKRIAGGRGSLIGCALLVVVACGTDANETTSEPPETIPGVGGNVSHPVAQGGTGGVASAETQDDAGGGMGGAPGERDGGDLDTASNDSKKPSDGGQGGEKNDDAEPTVLALEPCDPYAPFEAPVPAFTGTMNADGLTFSANGLKAYISGVGTGGYDIFVATRNLVSNPFGTPTPLPSPPNTPQDERAPTLSPDGNTLYVTMIGTSGHPDIGAATWNTSTQQFGPIQGIGGINDNYYADQDPFWWNNPNLSLLLFASERPDGAHRDIFWTLGSGVSFGTPGRLDGGNAPVNIGSEDFRPVLTKDGLTLYFGSKRTGIGNDTGGDVWMARRTSIGVQFDPTTLANQWILNSSGVEYPVTVSPDGCTLYFASDEDTGFGQSMRLYKATRPTTAPAQATITMNVIGQGNVTQAPFNCGAGTPGQCTGSATPDYPYLFVASSHAQWSGTCTANGSRPSTDGVVVFATNGVCTVTFPTPAVGPGGACTTPINCQQGLTCTSGTCQCIPGVCSAACGCGGAGDPCTSSSNCNAGLTCTNGTCRPDHCANGVQDGDETGVNCGGSCPGCPGGGPCNTGDDCANGLNCVNGTCECTPNCEGKQCGADDECGGTCRCGPGEDGCAFDEECEDGLICFDETCMPPSCIQNPFIAGCGFPGAFCGPRCTRRPECDSDNDCPAGYICPDEPNGHFYAVPGLRICEFSECVFNSEEIGCGGPWDECGACRCTPQCEGKQCGDADLSNACGGRCTGLCEVGQSGCTFDSDCQADSVCRNAVCRPANPCARPDLSPPDCGSGSLCGDCPVLPAPSCVERSCGTDPVTGATCGPPCPVGETPPIEVPGEGGQTRVVVPEPSPNAVGVGALAGEFSVTEHGSATYTMPIEVPPGRAGIEPNLAIRYASSTGNGALGVGFSLDGLSTITRCQRTYAQDGHTAPVTGTTTDALCLDGQRLMQVPDNQAPYWSPGAEYRTAIDTFDKVVSLLVDGTLSFKVFKKDGRIFSYGSTTSSRGMLSSAVTTTWALSRIEDRSENFASVTYRNATNQAGSTVELLPLAIRYTGHGTQHGDREVIFDYLPGRSDALLGWRTGGGNIGRLMRLNRIDVRAGGALVRSYTLGYEATTPLDPTSRMYSIQECVPSACKPATTFQYYDAEPGFDAPQEISSADMQYDGHTHTTDEGLVRYGLVHRMGTEDWLSTASFNSYANDVTPITGTVGFVVSFVPYVGPFASMALDIAGQLLSDSGSEFLAHDVDFRHLDVHGPRRPCGGRYVPTQQIVASNPVHPDHEEIHARCPELIPTGRVIQGHGNSGVEQKALWTRPIWLIDVDGDGVQDQLFCSGGDIAFKLAKNQANRTEIPSGDDRDGTIEGFGDVCRAKCSNVAEACGYGGEPPPQGTNCNRYITCEAQRQFSTALDVNGDGTSELVVYDKNEGWAALVFDGTSFHWRTDWFASVSVDANRTEYVTTIDANGDGLRDFVALPSGALLTNTGNGFVQQNLGGATSLPEYPMFVVDTDNDGIEELVYPSSPFEAPWRIRRIAGGFMTVEDFDLVAGPGVLGDFNGDGNLDAFTRGLFTTIPPTVLPFKLFHGKQERHKHLLKTVIDGLGHRVDIEYDGPITVGERSTALDNLAVDVIVDNPGRYCRWPVRCPFKVDHPLVTEYVESHYVDQERSNQDEDRRLSYAYHHPQVDMGGYGFLGFLGRQIVVRDRFGIVMSDTTIIATEAEPVAATPYRYVKAGLTRFVGTEPLDTHPIDLPGGSPSTEVYTSWEVLTSSKGLPFPHAFQKFTYTYGPGGAETEVLMTQTVEAQSQDGYGNIFAQQVTSSDIVNGATISGSTITAVTRDFDLGENRIDDWLISLPLNETTQSIPRCFNPADCTERTRGRFVEFVHDDNGLLQTIHREPGKPELRQNMTLTRDAFGNVERIVSTDDSGRAREVFVDFDDRGLFPTSIHQVGEGTEHVTHVRYDDRFGALASRADPNGIDETWTLDDFGVVRRQSGPDGHVVTNYELADFHTVSGAAFYVEAAYRIITTQTGGQSTIEEYNSFGQLVHQVDHGFYGQPVSVEYNYDHRRRVVQYSRPHVAGDSSQGDFDLNYDNLDRPIYQARSDGAVIRREYSFITNFDDPDISRLAFPVGAVAITKTFERVSETEERVSFASANRLGQPNGVFDASGIHTFYEYGAYDTLEFIGRLGIEDVEPVITLQHDGWGRTTSVHDEARGGPETTVYNGFDEVVSTTDAADRTRTRFYDDFGRLERLEDPDGDTSFIYDQGTNAIGRVSETVSTTGQRTVYGYEPRTGARNRGILNRITRHISPLALDGSATGEARELTTEYVYDGDSLLEQVNYPQTGNVVRSVKYTYDEFGHMIRAFNPNDEAEIYWELVSADQGYRIGVERIGRASCGSVQGTTTTHSYHPFNGRVQSITTTCNNQTLQGLTYSYDLLDNLFARWDSRAGTTEYFGYDAIDRLVATNGVETHRYHPVNGRLDFQAGVGDYEYEGEGIGRDWIREAGDFVYQHDDVGNVSLRTGPSVPGTLQTFDYTAFDLPKRIVSGLGPTTTTQFAYDALEERVLKQDTDGTKFYAGDHYHRVEQGAQTRHRQVIYAGGRAIAQIGTLEDAGGLGTPNVRYLYADALGSVQTIAGPDGTFQGARDYAPFGEQRASGGLDTNVPVGFTGHEGDTDLGLINMGGRIYDAKIGQFLSADPVISNPMGQGLNRFAYVDNSPLNFVDPTGFRKVWWTTGDTGADMAIGVGAFVGATIGYAAISTISASVSAASNTAGAAAGAAGAAGGGYAPNIISAVVNTPNLVRGLSYGGTVKTHQSRGVTMSRSQVAQTGRRPGFGRGGQSWAPESKLDTPLPNGTGAGPSLAKKIPLTEFDTERPGVQIEVPFELEDLTKILKSPPKPPEKPAMLGGLRGPRPDFSKPPPRGNAKAYAKARGDVTNRVGKYAWEKRQVVIDGVGKAHTTMAKDGSAVPWIVWVFAGGTAGGAGTLVYVACSGENANCDLEWPGMTEKQKEEEE